MSNLIKEYRTVFHLPRTVTAICRIKTEASIPVMIGSLDLQTSKFFYPSLLPFPYQALYAQYTLLVNRSRQTTARTTSRRHSAFAVRLRGGRCGDRISKYLPVGGGNVGATGV